MGMKPVLATVAVSDFAASSAWYERLFGRAPDESQGMECVRWKIGAGAMVQISLAAAVDRRVDEGASVFSIVVQSLDEAIAELRQRRIEIASPRPATRFVRFAPASDPDGNLVTFVESMAA